MSNLFKEVVADAKAIRKTAIANARVALEEAFSERYQAMFAEKLKEDASIDDVAVSADAKPEETAGAAVTDQEIDELIKELENDAQQEPDGDETPGVPAASTPAPTIPGVPAAPAAPGAPQSVICPVGTVATADMPPAVPPTAEVPGAPAPGTSVPSTAEVPTDAPAGETPAAPADKATPGAPGAENKGDEEDVNLSELLASLKEEVEKDEKEKDDEDDEEKDDEEINEDTKLTSSGIGGNKAGGSANKKPASGAASSSKIESGGIKNEGVPSVDSTKVGPEDATTAARPNVSPSAKKDNLSTHALSGTAKGEKVARPNSDGTISDTATLKENEQLKSQLKEAEEAIRFVQEQLNEVNLLNAKLLFTNKLFKENNMTNEQKMRVVDLFDLAKNVREVKMTYATIAESMNFSATDSKKKSIKSSIVQHITEGLASKPVGSTKPSQELISESKAQEMITKFQRLAGITKS